MEDDVREALEELRSELADQRRARTPAAQREARSGVAEAREDLEEVLRREGYHLSRRELDAMLEQRDEAKFRARMDRYLDELAAGEEEAGEEDDDAGEGGEKPKGEKPKGSSSSSRRSRAAAAVRGAAGGGDGKPGEEDDEWQ